MNPLALTPDPLDPHAYYDRMGNRHVFRSHREYIVARQTQIIAWLSKRITPSFL